MRVRLPPGLVVPRMGLREWLFMMFAVATVVIAVVLLLSVAGVVNLVRTKDSSGFLAATPSPTPSGTASSQGAEAEEGQGMGVFGIILLVFLGLGMLAAGGYVIYYKLKGYHGYIRWLARAAWMFPLPALLSFIGILLRMVTDLPLFTGFVSDMFLISAAFSLLVELVWFKANQKMREWKKMQDKFFDEFLMQPYRKVKGFAEGQFRVAAENIGVAKEKVDEFVNQVKESVVGAGDAIFATSESDLRASLAHIDDYGLRQALLVNPRVNGKAKPHPTDPEALANRIRHDEEAIRAIFRKYTSGKSKDEKDELWSQMVLGLNVWRSLVTERYASELGNRIMEEIETDRKGLPLYSSHDDDFGEE